MIFIDLANLVKFWPMHKCINSFTSTFTMYGYSHYCDVIMGAVASQITSLTIVYSTVYSDPDQSNYQSSTSLALVWGIHRGLVNSPYKWPVTRKMIPFYDVIMPWLTLLSHDVSHDVNKFCILAVVSFSNSLSVTMIVTKWTGLCYYIGALMIYWLAYVIMVVVDGLVPNKHWRHFDYRIRGMILHNIHSSLQPINNLYLRQVGRLATTEFLCHWQVHILTVIRLWNWTTRVHKSQLISPWTKWSPFHGQYFQIHFCEWKVWYFNQNCTEVCSQGSHWQ